MVPTTLRTGLVGEEADGGAAETTVVALMRVFMKDAILVAGRCTCAQGRRTVTGEDMQRALKYCARTFFERDDQDLSEVLERERREMDDEEEEDEEMDDEEMDDEEEEDEEMDDEEMDDEEEDGEEEEPDPSDVQLSRNVDTVVEHWHLWTPDDPVHALIKRAIDNTPL